MPIAVQQNKKKIIGIGRPQGAIKEFEELCRDFDVHVVERGPRGKVIPEIERICAEHGPFEAAYILFANGGWAPMDEELCAAMWKDGNNVGCFAQCGTGYDNCVIPDYTKHNCYFTNTPDAVTQSTADFTVFLFLAALRGSTYCEMVANKGLWHQGLELTTDPDGLTLGVIGMGRIGKDFARKVRAFGVKIIYNTRTRLPEEEEKTLGLTYVSKAELVKTSDVISCLTPFTAETYHLLDHDEFKAMKNGVFIINSSRGPVINEDALIDALKSNKVKRAALDVFEKEPSIPEYFLNNPKVTVMPHVAAYTDGTIYRGERDAFANCRAFLETGKPVTPVNGPF